MPTLRLFAIVGRCPIFSLSIIQSLNSPSKMAGHDPFHRRNTTSLRQEITLGIYPLFSPGSSISMDLCCHQRNPLLVICLKESPLAPASPQLSAPLFYSSLQENSQKESFLLLSEFCLILFFLKAVPFGISFHYSIETPLIQGPMLLAADISGHLTQFTSY